MPESTYLSKPGSFTSPVANCHLKPIPMFGNRGMRVLLLLAVLFSAFSATRAQLSGAGALSAWAYTGGSNDQSIHPGLNIRGIWDFHQFAFDAGFSYYMPVENSVPAKAIFITFPYQDPLAPKINIYNNVKGTSWQGFLHLEYYFLGLPTKGTGLYGIFGPGVLYYTQEYDLSDFDENTYRPMGINDGYRKSISQYTINIGLGGSFPVRKSNLFCELRFSFPTNRDKDIDYAITSAHFLTVEAGYRFPIISRKSRWERMALGRKSGVIKKSKARIRQ